MSNSHPSKTPSNTKTRRNFLGLGAAMAAAGLTFQNSAGPVTGQDDEESEDGESE